ncbi:MAG TPA: hypothetical protein VNE71_01730 [Myxococcota bacterium]|nr:hypothetical protein [Myxococcota bacterium]
MSSRRPLLLLLAAACAATVPAHAATTDGVFAASNGLAGPYRLVVPDALTGSAPIGLLVYFHADGDVASFPTRANGLVPRGEASRLAVAALSVPRDDATDGTPPTDPADQCWWAPRVERNAVYLDQWIQQVVRPVLGARFDGERVFFAGISGGADFAAAANVHLGFRYGGGAVAVCGGDLPRTDGGSCIADPAPPLVEPLPGPADVPPGATDAYVYSFDVTKNDPLAELAAEARDLYDALGFPVWFHQPAGSGGHCEFGEAVESVLDRRIEAAASYIAPGGCNETDISGFADALVDAVPFEVASTAIPADDAEREVRLAAITAELDAIADLAASLPDTVDTCGPRSDCPKLSLAPLRNEIRAHLAKLKVHLVPGALRRSDDPALRKSLREENLASHRAKKAALRSIPAKARRCDV